MNLVSLITSLATVMGTDIKDLAAEIASVEAKQGDLTTLNTTSKDTLVNALNELHTSVGSLNSTVVDAATIQGMIDTGIGSLVDGAPDALNTLNEIAQALAEDDTAIDGILVSLAKRVRVDAPQAFTAAEKTQGRDNIGAQDAEEIGDVAGADFVAAFNASKSA